MDINELKAKAEELRAEAEKLEAKTKESINNIKQVEENESIKSTQKIESAKSWLIEFISNTSVRTIKIIILILIIAAIIFAGNKVYNLFFSSGPVPVTISREEITQPETIKKKINSAQSTKITSEQATEISNTIQKYEDEDKQPYEIINTTKKNYQKAAAAEAKKVGADATVITPAKNETRDINTVSSNTPVNLNQYNIEAYPKHQLGITYYSDKEVAVDYDIKFRLFGKTAYIGPAVKYDARDHSTAGGIKINIPL